MVLEVFDPSGGVMREASRGQTLEVKYSKHLSSPA